MTYKEWFKKSQRVQKISKMKYFVRTKIESLSRPTHALKRPFWGFLKKWAVELFVIIAIVSLAYDIIVYFLSVLLASTF